MGQTETSSSPVDASFFQYVVGIDIGSQSCSFCTLKPDKSQVIKPTRFPNALSGFTFLHEQLERLGVAPNQVLIGLEATSRDARKSLSLPGKPGISDVLAASPSNSSVCTAARMKSEDRYLGCQYHCPSAAQR